jgi:carboxymethylenebutenolidase
MERKDIRIKSSDGNGEFDCYVVAPAGSGKVPAMVLASAIHGVTSELKAIADEFAAAGYLAAAPDLFWRTVPGPLSRDDPRTTPRGQPRLEVIAKGEADMRDTLAMIHAHLRSNGKAAAIGFCFGGPYAAIGPARLGYDAGVSCHGTQMLDYIDVATSVSGKPVCIIWGDADHAAPKPVIDAYRALAARQSNIALHVFPGVKHGYMMRDAPQAFDAKTREFSMQQALAILAGLRT